MHKYVHIHLLTFPPPGEGEEGAFAGTAAANAFAEDGAQIQAGAGTTLGGTATCSTISLLMRITMLSPMSSLYLTY